VLRLKSGLKMHSDEFLSQYTVYRLDPDSGFPIISLEMGNEPEKLCPFVSSGGAARFTAIAQQPAACIPWAGHQVKAKTKRDGKRSFFFWIHRVALESRKKRYGA